MKLFITARYKGLVNKAEIESLCAAVKSSGIVDFCFIRDVETYGHVFANPKDLWERALAELADCDALLIDVSDNPSGGRVVEAGIAYGLHKPILVIARRGSRYKSVYDGIAAQIIEYGDYQDIIGPLSRYLADSVVARF